MSDKDQIINKLLDALIECTNQYLNIAQQLEIAATNLREQIDELKVLSHEPQNHDRSFPRRA